MLTQPSPTPPSKAHITVHSLSIRLHIITSCTVRRDWWTINRSSERWWMLICLSFTATFYVSSPLLANLWLSFSINENESHNTRQSSGRCRRTHPYSDISRYALHTLRCCEPHKFLALCKNTENLFLDPHSSRSRIAYMYATHRRAQRGKLSLSAAVCDCGVWSLSRSLVQHICRMSISVDVENMFIRDEIYRGFSRVNDQQHLWHLLNLFSIFYFPLHLRRFHVHVTDMLAQLDTISVFFRNLCDEC